jgi:hypothetical protein
MSANETRSRLDPTDRASWDDPWEVCEVAYRRGRLSAAFVAVRQGRENDAVARSPQFRSLRGSSAQPAASPEIVSCLTALETELASNGWERIEEAENGWYSLRFRRRAAPLRHRISAYSAGIEPLLFAPGTQNGHEDAAIDSHPTEVPAVARDLPSVHAKAILVESIEPFRAENGPVEPGETASLEAESGHAEASLLEPGQTGSSSGEPTRVEHPDLPRQKRARVKLTGRKQIKSKQRPAPLIEDEGVEAERLAAARIEAARVEAERVEAERRLEAERVEAARLEAERIEAERRIEAKRIEAQRIEALRLEAERVEAERVAARLEAARLEAARIEAARVEAARVEAARLEAARLEARELEELRLESQRLDDEGSSDEPSNVPLLALIGAYSASCDPHVEIRASFARKELPRRASRITDRRW